MMHHLVIIIGFVAASALALSEDVDDTTTFPITPPTHTMVNQLGQLVRHFIPAPVRNFISGYQGKAAGFQIDLALSGVTDDSLFASAKAKWEGIITSDLQEVTGFIGLDPCGCLPCTVDDLYICGEYRDIDGPEGILGFAGVTRIRVSGSLPVTGGMYVYISFVLLKEKREICLYIYIGY